MDDPENMYSITFIISLIKQSALAHVSVSIWFLKTSTVQFNTIYHYIPQRTKENKAQATNRQKYTAWKKHELQLKTCTKSSVWSDRTTATLQKWTW